MLYLHHLIRYFSKYLSKGYDLLGLQETFRALGDPVRREILTLLRKGKMSAGELGAHFDITGATISYHLSQLKKAGLIVEEQDKNFIYYQLSASVFEEIMLWLSDFREEKDDEAK